MTGVTTQPFSIEGPAPPHPYPPAPHSAALPRTSGATVFAAALGFLLTLPFAALAGALVGMGIVWLAQRRYLAGSDVGGLLPLFDALGTGTLVYGAIFALICLWTVLVLVKTLQRRRWAANCAVFTFATFAGLIVLGLARSGANIEGWTGAILVGDILVAVALVTPGARAHLRSGRWRPNAAPAVLGTFLTLGVVSGFAAWVAVPALGRNSSTSYRYGGSSVSTTRPRATATTSASWAVATTTTRATTTTTRSTTTTTRATATTVRSTTTLVAADRFSRELTYESRVVIDGIGPIRVGMSTAEAARSADVEFPPGSSGSGSYDPLARLRGWW